ncbi:MAG: DegT/DnrJ/EryC1/StrS family aminotransferase [Patescibacteria group bacterium]
MISCAGNGGKLCVNSRDYLREAQLLRSWGRSSSVFVDSEALENRFRVRIANMNYDAKFIFEKIGYNYEPSEIGAAFGLIQLKNLYKNIKTREKNFRRQYNFFKAYQNWFILPQQNPSAITGWLAFPIIVKDKAPFSRNELQIFLEKKNIQTRVIFTGNALKQPAFKNIKKRISRDGYENADNVMRGGILLACHHGLTEEIFEYMHEVLSKFLDNYEK